MPVDADPAPVTTPPPAARRFATTRWSLVQAAARGEPVEAHEALAALCEAYWYPLYGEARRRGLNAEDARDRVQGFFARILERNDLAVADAERGRFRSFLLAAFTHYLANEWDRERAQKRGGGKVHLTLDLSAGESRLSLEPQVADNPERIYDRRWALALIERALSRLRNEYERLGKLTLFEALLPAMTGGDSQPYAALAEQLSSTEGAIKVTVSRLRGRCRDLIRDEIAQTVGSPEEIDDELRALFRVLGSGSARPQGTA